MMLMPEMEEKGTLAQRLANLTIADGLLFVVMILAAIMRLPNLSRIPLAPNEAESALAVWQLWQPDPVTAVADSALYVSLTTLFTQLLGFNDVVVRLWPALVGIALVYLPWLLKRQIGSIGALTMSLLLAISPLNSVLARTASGDSLALFALLLVFVGWSRYQHERDASSFYLTAVALGLGLTTSALFYSGLVSLLPLLWFLSSGNAKKDEVSSFSWRNAVFITIGTFLMAATTGLWYPAGLGLAARSLGDWFLGFSLNNVHIIDPFIAIIRYEIVLVLFGIFALFWSLLPGRRVAVRMAAYWVVTLLLLTLLRQGEVTLIPLLAIPGYLLVGALTNDAFSYASDQMTWGVGGSLAVLGALFLASLTRYNRVVVTDPTDRSYLWLAIIMLVFAVGTVLFFLAWDTTVAYQGAILGGLIVLVVYQWGIGWRLGHHAANDPRERWVTTTTTDDDLPIIMETLAEISHQTVNSLEDLQLFSTIDSAVLRWYLREYNNLQIGSTLPIDATYEVIITPAQVEEPRLASDYVGSDFGLLRTGAQPQVQSNTLLLDALRWWFFQDTTYVITEERVILWLRADLTQS